jgi:hypothetical protein
MAAASTDSPDCWVKAGIPQLPSIEFEGHSKLRYSVVKTPSSSSLLVGGLERDPFHSIHNEESKTNAAKV